MEPAMTKKKKIAKKKKIVKYTEEELQEYFKECLLNIVTDEDISSDTLMDCLKVILESEILSRSTEDLEFRMAQHGKAIDVDYDAYED